MKKENAPLSQLPMKVGRVSPLSLFKEVRFFSSNLGGNAGNTLVPVYMGSGVFLIAPTPLILDMLVEIRRKKDAGY
nr:hypothetical protein [Anaerotignum sp.]